MTRDGSVTVAAYTKWLHERRAILDRIEIAIHDGDGDATGQVVVLTTESL